MTTLTLEQCLAVRRETAPSSVSEPSGEASGEALADALFIAGAYAEAVDAYAECLPRTSTLDAKHGYCLAAVDRFDEAATLLTEDTCAGSARALAVLAVALAGGWERWGLEAEPPTDKGSATATRKGRARAALDLALAVDRPPSLAFYVYQSLVPWYGDREAALELAERACGLYSIEWLDVWRCQLLRTLDRPDGGALDAVLARLPGTDDPDTPREAFASAIALDRFDDAVAVIDHGEGALAEGQVDRDFGLLRAWIELRRALAGDAPAAGRAIAGASAWFSATSSFEPPHAPARPLAAQKLLLAAGVLTGDDMVVKSAAVALMDIWDDDKWSADYGPDMEMISTGSLLHEADFGEGYKSGILRKALGSGEWERWQFHLALRIHLNVDSEDEDALDDIRMYGPAFAPGWALRDVASVLIDDPSPQMRDAGRLLAVHCLREDDAGAEADLSDFLFDQFPAEDLDRFLDGVFIGLSGRESSSHGAARPLVDALCNRLFAVKAFEAQRKLADLAVEGTGETNDALFHAALARQNLNDLAGARERYVAVLAADPTFRVAYGNLALIHADLGDAQAVKALQTAFNAHAVPSDERWAQTATVLANGLKRATAQKNGQDQIAQRAWAIAAFPALVQEAPSPDSLSLPEAAMLLALSRACDQDHVHWTLSPFGKGTIPLAPTSYFNQALFALARKGIVAISETSPVSAFGEREGRPTFALDELTWRISPGTLTLQRAIRDMPRKDWPDAWEVHAESFSRDLAVEECIRYMEYQAGQVDIDAPSREDARPVLRGFLEHSSIGQCFYFIHHGAKSALEYKVKYGAARKAVTTVMLKRLTERGERAIENGWDTCYDRIRALPRTHLESALHDVLTGWGERVMTTPVRVLDAGSGDGDGPSGDRKGS